MSNPTWSTPNCVRVLLTGRETEGGVQHQHQHRGRRGQHQHRGRDRGLGVFESASLVFVAFLPSVLAWRGAWGYFLSQEQRMRSNFAPADIMEPLVRRWISFLVGFRVFKGTWRARSDPPMSV